MQGLFFDSRGRCAFGLWSKISKEDLNKLERLQNNGWEVFQCEFVKPSPEVSEDYRRKNNGNH